MFRSVTRILVVVGLCLFVMAPGIWAKDDFKVALLVTDSINDAGWNAAAYQGLLRIRDELGAKVVYSEKVGVADAEPALREFSSEGYDLILAHSFEYGDAVMKVAPDYPKTKYCVFTGIVKAPNVCSIELLEHEDGYLAGALAALMTKTNKIGVIVGSDIPVMVRIVEAFKIGAKSVNPKIKVFDVYVGAWDDMAKGKEAARGMIENGADVIYHVADKTGLGAIQAAKEAGVWAIGSSADQSPVAPGTVLTSTTHDTALAYLKVAKAVKEGKFEGKIYRMNLASGVLGLAPYAPSVPQSVRDKIAELKAKIVSGELVVPEIYEKTK